MWLAAQLSILDETCGKVGGKVNNSKYVFYRKE